MKNFSTAVAAQNKASAAIPAVVSPPVNTAADIGPQTLLFQTVQVPAQQRYPIQIKGNYIYIEGVRINTTGGIQSTGAQITIKTDTGNTPVTLIENFREFRFPQNFNFFEFNNTSSFPVLITFYAGFGQVRRDYEPRFITCQVTGSPPALGAVIPANSVVAPFYFPKAGSPYTSRGRIRKVSCIKNNTNAADFSLWLFNVNANFVANTPFVLFLAPIQPENFIGVVRFPSFIGGGAGSTYNLCDVADIDLPFLSQATNTDGYGDGTIYGALVANAAYTSAVGEGIQVHLQIET